MRIIKPLNRLRENTNSINSAVCPLLGRSKCIKTIYIGTLYIVLCIILCHYISWRSTIRGFTRGKIIILSVHSVVDVWVCLFVCLFVCLCEDTEVSTLSEVEKLLICTLTTYG